MSAFNNMMNTFWPERAIRKRLQLQQMQTRPLRGLLDDADPRSSQFHGLLNAGLPKEALGLIGVGAQKPKYMITDYGTEGGQVQKGFVNPLNPNEPPIPFGSPYERRSGVTVNVGQGKPLGAGAANWRNNKGESPPPSYDIYEAERGGYRPTTSEQRKGMEAAQGVTPLLATGINSAFGDKNQKSLFPPENSGLINRTISGADAYLDGLMQSNLRINNYNIAKDATISNIARIGGQTGVLTEQDVDRMKTLWPKPGFTPEPIAIQQFQNMISLLIGKGMTKEQLLQAGMPRWLIDGRGRDQNKNNEGNGPWNKYK